MIGVKYIQAITKTEYIWLTSLKYTFNVAKSAVTLNKKIVVIKFIQEFLEPFKSIIPKNMYYKLDYEDIVGNL